MSAVRVTHLLPCPCLWCRLQHNRHHLPLPLLLLVGGLRPPPPWLPETSCPAARQTAGAGSAIRVGDLCTHQLVLVLPMCTCLSLAHLLLLLRSNCCCCCCRPIFPLLPLPWVGLGCLAHGGAVLRAVLFWLRVCSVSARDARVFAFDPAETKPSAGFVAPQAGQDAG